MFTIRCLISGFLLWLGGIQVSVASLVFDVTMDTSALNGAPALLVFDFIDGDGLVNNTVSIDAFTSDGVYDPTAAMTFGDVTGALDTSVVLGDSGGFNELAQLSILGNALSFTLALSNQFRGIGLPDRLTLFLLDELTFLPLYPTNDPTGSGALLAIDLDGGAARAVVYEPTATAGGRAIVEVGAAIPEPPIWSLWLLGALIGGFLRTVPRRSLSTSIKSRPTDLLYAPNIKAARPG